MKESILALYFPHRWTQKRCFKWCAARGMFAVVFVHAFSVAKQQFACSYLEVDLNHLDL